MAIIKYIVDIDKHAVAIFMYMVVASVKYMDAILKFLIPNYTVIIVKYIVSNCQVHERYSQGLNRKVYIVAIANYMVTIAKY